MIEGQNVKRAGISTFSIILLEIHIFYTINLSNMYIFCYIYKNKTANDMIKKETAEMIAKSYTYLDEIKKSIKEVRKQMNVPKKDAQLYHLRLYTDNGETLMNLYAVPEIILPILNKTKNIVKDTQKMWNYRARKESEKENQV